MTRIRLTVTTLALPLLSACGSAPPMQPPQLDLDPPDSYAESTGASTATSPVEEVWWDSFESPGLSGVVAEALAGNNDLVAAAASVQAARAAAKIEGADLWPQVNASASRTRDRRNFIGFPVPGNPVAYTTTYNTALTASWEIDLWGRVRSARSAAVAEAQASAADLAGARLSVAAQAAQAWMAMTEASLQLRLAEETLAAFRETEQIADRRYRRGLLSPFDVRLTQSSTASAAALVASRRNQLQATTRGLEILLGRYPSASLSPGEDLPPPPPPVPPGLPADLVARRPDLAAAERRLAASHAQVGTAKAARYPQLALTGSTGTTSSALEDLFNGDFSVWSIVGSLVQPIFQGGRITGAIALSEAVEDQHLARFVQQTLNAFAEVENALANERFAAQEVHHLTVAAEQARAAWRLSEDRYGQGLGDLLSVLESQRRALAAQSDLLSARRRRLDARVDLYRALGGGFEAPSIFVHSSTPPAGR